MLLVSNLHTNLFEDINLKVNAGEIVAIIGNNGCGKSTLAKTISGYYKPLQGEVNLASNQIGLITQNPFLQFVGSTVYDEITYSLEQEEVSRSEIDKILENCPLPLTLSLHKLTGNKAQQLLLYKQFVSSKKLIILDETLSNLSYEQKQEIMNTIKTSNKAIILITNNIIDTSFASIVYKLENKRLSKVDITINDPIYLENKNQIGFKYEKMTFKYGLNLLFGNEDVEQLLVDIAHNSQQKVSLIPKFPFEAITQQNYKNSFDKQIAEQIQLKKIHFEQNATTLSTGELVKVLIVNAIKNESKIIIIDEVIEVIDNDTRNSVLQLILNNFETIIIASHNKYMFNNREVNEVHTHESNNS